ncbi:Homeobox protein Nkx-2.1 [Blomia tropicalis]|nr:Homeobox protein Nkx-2.1 [Blomia tropicalis]
METKKKKKEKKKHKKIPQEFIENPTSDQHDSGKKRKHSSSIVEKIKDNTSKTKFKKIKHELTEEDAQANDFLLKEWTEKEIEEFESGNIDLETAKNQIDCSELPDALPFKRKPNEIIGENHESTLLIHQLVPRLTQLTGEDRKLLAKHDLVVQSGRFNQFENAILKRNWDLYLKDYNVPNPLMLFGFFKRNGEQNNPAKTYCYAFTHKTKLLLRLAKDLPHRTLYQIYCRARILLSGLKQARDFTDEDRKLILELHTKHGDRYATFCEEYGFNPKCAREVVRNAVKANGVQLKRGAWNSEELDKLKTNVLRIMKEENIISYSRIPWSKVAADMKRSDIQCRQRFFSKVFFKVMQDQNESKKWNEQYDIVRLIALMKRCGWADDALIDWDFIKEKFSIDCFNILSRSWSRVRLNVPDFQSKTLKEIVDYLYDTRVRKFAKKDPRAFEQIEKFVEDCINDK